LAEIVTAPLRLIAKAGLNVTVTDCDAPGAIVPPAQFPLNHPFG
jgi:hypothetical protein